MDCILFSSLRKLKLLSPDPHWICNSKEISGKTQKIVCSSLDLCKLKRASYLLCSSPLIPDPRWVWSKKISKIFWSLRIISPGLKKKPCSRFFFSDGHLEYDNSWNSDSRSFFSPESDTTIHMYYTYLEMKARQKRGQNYITGITANYAGTLEDSFVFMTKKH